MNTGKTSLSPVKTRISPEIIDLLATSPSTESFCDRVRSLELSPQLEKKILSQDCLATDYPSCEKKASLTLNDERELASEVLRYRHLFTEKLLGSKKFRQATLTVIQNIYLFNNRKIFFGTTTASTEKERQEALSLFSTALDGTSLPLDKTFQHLIIARIWNRIISQSSTEIKFWDRQFKALHDVVEKLNTIRNSYMLLSIGLVKKLATKTNAIYKDSVTYQDAVQMGEVGIARAAYRYHHSCGVRFSTFAANWVFREIQRQALNCRLIRISSNTVERFSKASKEKDEDNLNKYSTIIKNSTTVGWDLYKEKKALSLSDTMTSDESPLTILEEGEQREILMKAIDQVLSKKSSDIIKRRFGLPPYNGGEQSIISISEKYRVTRGSIYQLEQTSFKKLSAHLRRFLD